MCVGLDRWGSRNNLVGAGEGEGITRIYSMKKMYFQLEKRKKENHFVLGHFIPYSTHILAPYSFILRNIASGRLYRSQRATVMGLISPSLSSIPSVLVASHEYLNQLESSICNAAWLWRPDNNKVLCFQVPETFVPVTHSHAIRMLTLAQQEDHLAREGNGYSHKQPGKSTTHIQP